MKIRRCESRPWKDGPYTEIGPAFHVHFQHDLGIKKSMCTAETSIFGKYP